MNKEVRAEFAGLSGLAKAQLRAWFNDALQVFIFDADEKSPEVIKAHAQLLRRAVTKAATDLREILGER